VLALGQEILQHALHSPQVRELRLDLGEPVSGNSANRRSIGTIFEQQELADLFERKAKLLRALDEANALHQAQGVVAKSTVARRDGQELAVLVVADRLDAYVGRTSEPPDRE